MNEKNFYSIRMRASAGGRHVSGAERIVPHKKIGSVMQELVSRAHGRTLVPDQVVVTLEPLNGALIHKLIALDIAVLNIPDMISGRFVASRALQATGVSAQAAEMALSCLSEGAAPSGGNMRGAVIMDALK